MKRWYQSLLDTGKLSAADRFAVTGYSLGGHLATAFNQLLVEAGQGNRITETYTFNGAGVGERIGVRPLFFSTDAAIGGLPSEAVGWVFSRHELLRSTAC